jgi:glycerol-3-phosphate acyltransferase PlsY
MRLERKPEELELNSLAIAYPVLAAIAAYLIGSLSFAVIVSRVMGLDRKSVV